MTRVAALLLALVLAGCAAPESPTNYRGWPNPAIVRGDGIEAVVIPSLGRIMDLRRPGEKEGVLWQNPALRGEPVRPDAASWTNFGGDKTWPAPESRWMKNAAGQWMPPKVFDQTPLRASLTEEGLRLESPVDALSGVRFTRLIRPAGRRTLAVTTTYTKVQGDPVDVAVWVVTQLAEPRVIATTANTQGPPVNLGFGKVKGVEVEQGVVFWKRFPDLCAKLGTTGRALAWVGDRHTLLITSVPGEPTGVFAGEGNRAEIYVNPDPLPYVELETLGHLRRLRIGESTSCTNFYRLDETREGESPKAAARRLLESAR
ncbi:MAG: hypothetical protein RIR32_576 [Verrucomicrobiota bacterium]|jgi:hypothetical protein